MEETLSMFILIHKTAAGILSLPMFLLGSISQPHSSFFQHPCSNWATSPSAVTHHFLRGEHMKRYRCTWSGTDLSRCGGFYIWIAYVDSWALRWHRADPGTALCFFSPVDACLYLYLLWCGSLVMMWPISFHVGQGYSPSVPEAAWQGSLSPILARTLSISPPRAPCLLNKIRAVVKGGKTCRYIWIADTFNLSSIARRHLMSLWVYPAKHTIKCTMRWETWLQFVWKKSQGLICPAEFY